MGGDSLERVVQTPSWAVHNDIFIHGPRIKNIKKINRMTRLCSYIRSLDFQNLNVYAPLPILNIFVALTMGYTEFKA